MNLTESGKAQQPQAHPLRCQTCGNREVNPNDDNYCKVIGDFIAGEIEMDTTAKVGCASHSASRQRIDDMRQVGTFDTIVRRDGIVCHMVPVDWVSLKIALLQQAGDHHE